LYTKYVVHAMKISYLYPKGTDAIQARKFIESEIAEAKSIKSKQTRKSVEAGLRAIAYCL